MDKRRKHQRLELFIRIILAVTFLTAAAGWDRCLREKDWQEIRRHSEVIENDLWSLDVDGCLSYLELAARLNKYEYLVVYTSTDEEFVRVDGQKASVLDQFLIRVGLIPRIHLEAEITHNDLLIGRIEASHRHDSIYTYLYFIVVILLSMLSLRFFIRIMQARDTLELRVQERTEELADEKERLAVTLRSIGDGVITTDLEGRIVLINTSSEQLTGWTQEEAVGRPIQEVFRIINGHTGEPCANPVDKVIATGQIVALANHTSLVARDGTHHDIEDSGAPIFDQKGLVIGTVLVYRDVTGEKRTKRELAKVKKLESVGVLAGGIAHDFNNILAGILGNVELAVLYTDPNSQAYPLLRETIKASLRAKGLTQQLLTFAKGGDPVKQAASITQIITDSANFVLHGSAVVCDYSIPDDLWQVDVDAGQISQVVQNIIINARHAMPQGGGVEVCCHNIDDGSVDCVGLLPQKYIKMTIADTGPGIPAQFVDKIFDPYFSTKQEGSGLGLAICHSIICKHDGIIYVESEGDRGTVFTIYLPASVAQVGGGDPVRADLSETDSNATIMVMDDEPMLREMTKHMLTRLGYNVVLVKDGHGAIEIYNKSFKDDNRSIDGIIMDLTIPGGLGGKETVQEILRIDAGAKVIVASGYSNDPVMARYMDYGFVASIAKPFQLLELQEILHHILK